MRKFLAFLFAIALTLGLVGSAQVANACFPEDPWPGLC